MKSIFAAILILISASAHADGVCGLLSKADADLAVALIKDQIKANPVRMASIDTSVSFRNITDAEVLRTRTGRSEVQVTTPTGKAVIDIGYSYLRVGLSSTAISLGRLTNCNNRSIDQLGLPMMKEMN